MVVKNNLNWTTMKS